MLILICKNITHGLAMSQSQFEPPHGKTNNLHMRKQRRRSASRIVQFLFYLNPKFQASSSLLCLYRSVCVRPVRKPHCWFSHEAAHLSQDVAVIQWITSCNKSMTTYVLTVFGVSQQVETQTGMVTHKRKHRLLFNCKNEFLFV